MKIFFSFFPRELASQGCTFSLGQRCVDSINISSVLVNSQLLVKLMIVRTRWGWEYFDQSGQKNSEQVVQRPRFKSHSCQVWVCGSWQISLQVFSLVKWKK